MITLARGGGTALIAFADVGDLVAVENDGASVVSVTGPMDDQDDYAAVAEALCLVGSRTKASISVGKLVPFDEGLGGTAPLVAASLRILKRAPGPQPAPDVDVLGTNVFACLASRAATLSEGAVFTASLPALHAVLVHGGGKAGTDVGVDLPDAPTDWGTAREVAQWLRALPLDVEDELAEVIDELAMAPGCLMARPSAAGGTCYGLFPDRSTAEGAAAHLAKLHPAWWVEAATLT
ncbi:MAG: hypothetical protein AAGA47_10970 [Pseudomonadota bacterium]